MSDHLTRFRDGARAPLLWKASLWAGDNEHSCTVLNLSLGGAKLQLAEPLERGTLIRLEIPDLCTLEGKACWYKFGCLGIQFSAPNKVRILLGDKVKTLGLEKSR